MRNMALRILGGGLLLCPFLHSTASQGSGSPAEIFEERILPIFNSDDPSSCTECHLSGVDLKNYLLPSAEKTFANLRDLGLVDLEAPGKSRILEFIGMAPDSDEYEGPVARRIDPAVRKAELDAFSAWIKAAAADPRYRDAPALSKADLAAPAVPPEVIRHGRTDRLLASYRENIWSLRFRCAGCHMPGGEKFEKHADEHGFEKMAWLRARGPAESMQVLMSGNLLDVDDPARSELLLKPLDEAEEEHGGGIKMRVGDTDYLAILNWIQDYANVVNGAYATAESLPSGPHMEGSEIWLRMTGLPDSLLDRRVLMTVHKPGDPKEPVAISSTTVVHRPKLDITMANGFLMRRNPTDETLEPGQYHVRLYRAGSFRAEAGSVIDWDREVESGTLLFSGEIRSKWRPGYKNSTVVDLEVLRAAGGRE